MCRETKCDIKVATLDSNILVKPFLESPVDACASLLNLYLPFSITFALADQFYKTFLSHVFCNFVFLMTEPSECLINNVLLIV